MPTIKLRGKSWDLHEPIRGAKRIAEIRGETERQTFHAVAEKRFAFRNNGRVIVSTPFEALVPLIGTDGIGRLIVPEPAAKPATAKPSAPVPPGKTADAAMHAETGIA
jgi:hypothetical protein